MKVEEVLMLLELFMEAEAIQMRMRLVFASFVKDPMHKKCLDMDR
jgi:hypothetical protein